MITRRNLIGTLGTSAALAAVAASKGARAAATAASSTADASTTGASAMGASAMGASAMGASAMGASAMGASATIAASATPATLPTAATPPNPATSPTTPKGNARAPFNPATPYKPVTTPNGSTLPVRVKNGVKVMHLVAEPVHHEFAPGLEAECWGYNGSTPGPTIEVVEGDTVRIYVTNKLPEPTSVHWHGVVLDNGMDGVAGLTQRAIAPGETFRYQFVLPRAGTFMYHPHYDEMTQMALGMMGMFVVHPKKAPAVVVDRDFAIMLSEWRVVPGTRRPDPSAMFDFNVVTMNSKAYPATAPLVVKRGDRVRVRLGNLGAMDHHPIHLHGGAFTTTSTDGGPVPVSAQHPETTVLVPVGTTRDVEWIADRNGDWPMHCHMTHHVMTQMGHDAPNLVGVDASGLGKALNESVPHTMIMGTDGTGSMSEMQMPQPTNTIAMRGSPGPFGTIDMGGMFTVVKVRDAVDEHTAASWYAHPEGTVARPATKAELDDDLG